MGKKVYGLQFHPEVTEEQMRSWMDSAAHMLELPGAHGRELQLADAKLHNRPLGLWLEDFIDLWLRDSGLPQRNVKAETAAL
jgi:GMP synthase (glutamine-hydrolysing)